MEITVIQVGQKVYSGLYGGRYGVVYAIRGEQHPETVGTMAGVLSYGGNAEFDIVSTNGTETRRLPESILHGTQWSIYDEVVSEDEIRTMREFAASETTRKQAEIEQKAKAFKAAVDALRSDPQYSNLQQTGEGESMYSAKLAAINIRRELKASFPGVKFSVKTDHYTEVRITWLDGPTSGQVRAMVDKYSGGFFDGMADSYESRDTPWTTVFSSANYVNVSRGHSVEAVTKAAEAVAKSHAYPLVHVEANSDGTGHAKKWLNSKSCSVFFRGIHSLAAQK